MTNTITTAAAWFRAAQGKVIRKTVSGVQTLESWPEYVESVKANLIAQGCEASNIVVDDDGLRILSTGQFVMRPKFRACQLGALLIRSADYAFIADDDAEARKVFGDKKGATIEAGNMIKRYPSGMTVQFEIVGERA